MLLLMDGSVRVRASLMLRAPVLASSALVMMSMGLLLLRAVRWASRVPVTMSCSVSVAGRAGCLTVFTRLTPVFCGIAAERETVRVCTGVFLSVFVPVAALGLSCAAAGETGVTMF